MHCARFEGKRNKGRSRRRWIDNINEDMTSVGLTINNGLDKGPRTTRTPFLPIAAKRQASEIDVDNVYTGNFVSCWNR